VTQRRDENIAAIATNIALRADATSIITDRQLAQGWVGQMREIVLYADAFTAAEEACDGECDWYVDIDRFTDQLCDFVVEFAELPVWHQYTRMAVESVVIDRPLKDAK
jgi:hypothetical protein